MIKAIVYTSYAGHTKEFAKLLGEKTGLPVYDLKAAGKELPKGAKVIFLGWLMAGTVKGYKKAAGCFTVNAVGAVGMTDTDSQLPGILKVNRIPEGLPVFILQGGFEMDKLHGIYALMMKAMKLTVGKGLSEKQDRTSEEDEMLDLLLNGGNCVSAEKLSGMLDWYRGVVGGQVE